MYGKDTFNPPTVWYCFSTKVNQEDVPLVQIQEPSGLFGETNISMIVALASVRERPQQAVTELREDHFRHIP